MATAATVAKLSEERPAAEPARRFMRRARKESDPYLLRALPNEEVFFFSKKIENRTVKQADPVAPKQCWSAIGTACILTVALAAGLFPSVGGVLAGYRLEQLRQERQRLVDEERVLDVRAALLTAPERMKQVARERHLTATRQEQVVRVYSRGDGALAMQKTESNQTRR